MGGYVPYNMADVARASSADLFSVVSTFAGCGGSSIGYRLAGGRVLVANEFLEVPRSMYEANSPGTILFDDDIRDIPSSEILDAAGLDVGELDILDGSPPCTAFSAARGGRGEDPYGREHEYCGRIQRVDDLFFEFARMIEELQPRAFVAENVKGLARGRAKRLLGIAKDGRLINRKGRRTILTTLARCGYRIHWKVMNSARYGVPQARERLIIVGVRRDVEGEHRWPDRSDRSTTLGEALVDLDQDEDERRWLLRAAADGKVGSLMAFIPRDPPRPILGDRYMRAGKYFSAVRCSLDHPSRTLAAFAGNVGAATLIHPLEDRGFTVQEAKRIMAFPDDYDLLDRPYSERMACLGRAVPPRLIEAIASSLHQGTLGVPRSDDIS